jgi:class 3 adenylate cyclase
LHTGECEVLDGKVGGIAVHIGARVAHEADPGEVLVSSTVKDLVAGSGLRFRERGFAQLKGVPEQWRLYAVDDDAANRERVTSLGRASAPFARVIRQKEIHRRDARPGRGVKLNVELS